MTVDDVLGVPVDREAGMPPVGLLCGDRQRHVPSSSRPWTGREHLRQRPVYIMSVRGAGHRPFSGGPTTSAIRSPGRGGGMRGRIVFRNAGVEPEDIQLTGCYDAFTFTPVLLVRGIRVLRPGGGRETTCRAGLPSWGGACPNNTSGGQLCEGYTHGMNLVIENVRQWRHQADDSAPRRAAHTFDYREGGCRQVAGRRAGHEHGLEGTPAVSSALILKEVAVEYRGLELAVIGTDSGHQGYYEAVGKGRLGSKRCGRCQLLRGEIGAVCRYCLSWPASGRGTTSAATG